MQDPILSSAFQIESNRAAAAFSDTLRRHVVLLLARQAHSITELAQLSGVELKRLHYHVTALQKLGLLQVMQEKKRAGRSVKMYRAVSPSFFVPIALMQTEPTDMLRTELRESLARQRDLSMAGVLYYQDENGKPIMRAIRHAKVKHVAVGEAWWMLNLTPTQVASLKQEIELCIKAYSKEEKNGKPYLLHFAVAPRA